MSAVGKHSQPYPWEQRKLGEIATIVGGGTPSTKNSEYWDGDINWYSPAEIGNQIYTVKSERQITELGLKKSSAKLLPVGTVLFTSRAGIGKTAILNKEACTNQGFQSIIPRPQILNSYFLFSRTNSLKQYGETMGSGSTFVEVSGKQMSKMPLFIPDINEQTRIAKLFQSLDKTITLHEEKQRQLEQLKKALLQKMFADKTGYPVLRFKGFTEKWEQRKFSELYSKNVERNSTNEFNFDKTISIAKMRYNSEGNGASKKSLQNYKVIRIGDVAFEGHTNKEFQYGRFVVNSLGNGIMSPRFAVLRPIRPTVVNFWKYYLHNERSMNRILVRATKAGTMMNELVYSDLAKEKIKVPIEKEQLEIGNLFSIVDKTITLHDKKIQYLKQLKRGLLQKMFV